MQAKARIAFWERRKNVRPQSPRTLMFAMRVCLQSLVLTLAAAITPVAAIAAAPPDCTRYGDDQTAPIGLTNIERIRAALDAGMAVDPVDGGYSLLQFAASDGDVALTALLLARGARTEYRDLNQDRALLWAAQQGRIETVKLLLDAGSPVQSDDDPFQTTPLMKAVTNGHLATACLLIARGADVNRPEQSNRSALEAAAQSSDPRMVEILLRAGANPNNTSQHLFETPLLVAASFGRAENIRLLIAAGANIDARNHQGETALWRAARRGDTEIVAILLDQPPPRGHAARAQRALDRDAAFVEAIWAPDGSGEFLLVERGASINAVDKDGRSAFAGVSRFPGTAMFDWFIGRGVNLNLHGNAALLEAARVGRADIVERLLAANVPVNGRDAAGVTALMIAAGQGHVEVVHVLVEAEGDASARDARARGVEDYMRAAAASMEASIARENASRSLQPVEDLERELVALRQNHTHIRAIIAARTVAPPITSQSTP
jgi:uncharacterized protein